MLPKQEGQITSRREFSMIMRKNWHLAPMLHFIFRQSYSSGTLPQDWRKALVTAIYKKGTKSSPENYRPVSLTCISCKILEHIVLSHVSTHLSSNNIITDNQCGFREKRSCETQLTDAVQDWSECLNRWTDRRVAFGLQ